jgi:hypothetical protein
MNEVWGWVFWLVVCGGLFVWFFVLSDSSKNAIWYGATYGVSTDNGSSIVVLKQGAVTRPAKRGLLTGERARFPELIPL